MQSNDPPAFGNIGAVSAQMSLENFGIAYSVSPIVSWVDPDAPKEIKQVAVGDELTQIAYEVTDADRQEFAKHDLKLPEKPEEVSAMRTLPLF